MQYDGKIPHIFIFIDYAIPILLHKGDSAPNSSFTSRSFSVSFAAYTNFFTSILSKVSSVYMSFIRFSSIIDPFTHQVRDPFAEYSNGRAISLAHISIYDQLTAFANPRIDCKETQDAYIFKIGLLRLKKDEVKVHLTMKDGVMELELRGERKVEREEKNDKWRRVERSSGMFVRKFKLPENVKAEQVKADLENGVLTVTVSKCNLQVNKSTIKAVKFS